LTIQSFVSHHQVRPLQSFVVASTPRYLDKQTNEWKDGESLFLQCQIWRQAAENVAESLTKGMRVILSGRLKATFI
jgi:single-strand DNA-binding protein